MTLGALAEDCPLQFGSVGVEIAVKRNLSPTLFRRLEPVIHNPVDHILGVDLGERVDLLPSQRVPGVAPPGVDRHVHPGVGQATDEPVRACRISRTVMRQ